MIFKNKHTLPFFWMFAGVSQRKASETEFTQLPHQLPCMLTGALADYGLPNQQEALHGSLHRAFPTFPPWATQANMRWRQLSHKNSLRQVYCIVQKIFSWQREKVCKFDQFLKIYPVLLHRLVRVKAKWFLTVAKSWSQYKETRKW